MHHIFSEAHDYDDQKNDMQIQNMIYHNTLTWSMQGKTIEWMLTTKIQDEDMVAYKQWIKPENSLNDMFDKKWKGQTIGNSPEVMPLDTCLF